MNQAYATSLNKFDNVLYVVKSSSQKAGMSVPSEKVLWLGALLIALQILDGIFTATGVHLFGTAAEGNLILRSLMHTLGCIPALILAKSFAIMVIVLLCSLTAQVRWLTGALKLVAFVYLGAAVLPWAGILITHFVMVS